MRSFSYISNPEASVIEQYTEFLKNEMSFHHGLHFDYSKISDPLFLKQLGTVRASYIQEAIETNGAILYQGVRHVNDAVRSQSRIIANQMAQVSKKITDSLDLGFIRLHHDLIGITEQQLQTNKYLCNINSSVKFLGMLVGEGFSMMHRKLSLSNSYLSSILRELSIPETQRERRYHLTEGCQYLSHALSSMDSRYFADAKDEFERVLQIYSKDAWAYFYLGYIHLRSASHLDIKKSLTLFGDFIHYAKVHPSPHIISAIDDAYLYRAEAYYLLQQPTYAYNETFGCTIKEDKARFMRVKYYSCKGKEKEAAEILKRLLQKNPYLVLQALEDGDIMRNKYVCPLLEQLRVQAVSDAQSKLDSISRKYISYWAESSIQSIVGEPVRLIRGGTYLGCLRAIELLNDSIADIERAKIPIDTRRREINARQALLRSLSSDGQHNGYSYVDLGLSVRWATANLEASSQLEYGGLYWARVRRSVPRTIDPAARIMGGRWRIPSNAQWTELLTRCRWTWTCNGMQVTGPNGKSIFLPAAGYQWNENDPRTYLARIGKYLSRDRTDYGDDGSPDCVEINDRGASLVKVFQGSYSIRPVYKKSWFE